METNFKSYLKCAGLLFGGFLLLFACSENPTSVKKEQLHLQASATEVTAGDEVSFEVTANARAVDADIYIDSSRINGSTYTFNEAGNHTVIAKKEGYIKSEKIEIQVTSIGGFVFRSIYVAEGDVYVAGAVSASTPPGRLVPVYWKNRNFHELSANGAVATSVYVSNGEVFIAGYSTYPFNDLTVGYWKNQNLHNLAPYGGRANSIYVSNGDVYVAGAEVDGDVYVATYWKNGTPNKLSDGKKAVANSIQLSEGDVYVAGSNAGSGSSGIDFYWKNGTRHKLSISGVAKAMDVFDGNVYVAGYEMVNSAAVAAYWKNGTLHKLSDGRANFINVTGGDVNVVGWRCDDTHCIVKYWKNGTLVSKYQISGSPTLSRSFISNEDVYIVGTIGGKPFYWKNGTRHKLNKE